MGKNRAEACRSGDKWGFGGKVNKLGLDRPCVRVRLEEEGDMNDALERGF